MQSTIMSNSYSIKDLERLSGIKAHTIRIWEQRYKLVSPIRSDSNIRSYSDAQLKRILNVSYLIKNGEKISKVATLDDQKLGQAVMEFQNSGNHGDDLNYLIEVLLSATIDLNEAHFDKTINNAILRNGFEQTILKLIYPFLERIGVMWRVNQVNPAQEHFVTNLIRQKVIAAIDGQLSSVTKNETYLLFLPEGEWHELGLLMAHYLLRQNGYKVFYVGQSVPLESLDQIYKTIQPHNILLFFISSQNLDEPAQYLKQVSNLWPQSKIYFSGNPELINSFEPAPNLHHLKDFNAFKLSLNNSKSRV